MLRGDFVIIGGGIAGVSCAQEIVRVSLDQRVLIISATDTLSEVKAKLLILSQNISHYDLLVTEHH
jgi:L-2-hydroxyglutarate oxidase LhgO